MGRDRAGGSPGPGLWRGVGRGRLPPVLSRGAKMPRRCLFLLSSARPGGNSETLARRAAAGLPPETATDWADLARPALPAFADLRPGAAAPAGRLAGLAAAVLAADDLIFVAPVYWYALPAPAKLCLDHWSGWLDLPGFATGLRGKRLWLITARADPAPGVPEPAERAMRMTADWLGLHWGGALHGIGDAPGEVAGDAAAWDAAPGFLLPA